MRLREAQPWVRTSGLQPGKQEGYVEGSVLSSPPPQAEETSANTPGSHLLTKQLSSFPSSLPLRG